MVVVFYLVTALYTTYATHDSSSKFLSAEDATIAAYSDFFDTYHLYTRSIATVTYDAAYVHKETIRFIVANKDLLNLFQGVDTSSDEARFYITSIQLMYPFYDELHATTLYAFLKTNDCLEKLLIIEPLARGVIPEVVYLDYPEIYPKCKVAAKIVVCEILDGVILCFKNYWQIFNQA